MQALRVPVEAALLGVLVSLVSATGARGIGYGSLLPRLLTLEGEAWFSTCGGCGVSWPSSRVTSTGSSPRGTAPPPPLPAFLRRSSSAFFSFSDSRRFMWHSSS